jgi:hypothetical protein
MFPSSIQTHQELRFQDRFNLKLSNNHTPRCLIIRQSASDRVKNLGYSDSANRASMINFSISYRFGKLKASVKKTETTIDNSDVVGGITKGN